MVMPCPMQACGALSVQQEHRCHWRVSPYDGGPYRHTFRTCSYCCGMHPEDLISLIEDHGADVSGTTKGHKFYVERVPNPVAGRRCRSGSRSGPVFARQDLSLVQRLRHPSIMPRELGRASVRERITGHYERPMYSPAPEHCFAKFYTYHIESEEQQERLNRAIRTQRARRVPGD